MKKGQTVGIIEAMKLMNEIEAEASGEVVKVVAENGKPISAGQVSFSCIFSKRLFVPLQGKAAILGLFCILMPLDALNREHVRVCAHAYKLHAFAKTREPSCTEHWCMKP